MKNNLFIAVDGIDGSGKSEIIGLLHNYLFSKKKFRILTTREPTNGVHGEKIRRILREDKDPKTSSNLLFELFVKDREDHLKNTILPFLGSAKDECHVVLCDRYYYSTIAFQGAQGMDIEKLIEANKNFRKPDLVLILDVEPKTALERIKSREKEKFEQLGFMEKIRSNFLELSKYLDDNIKVIDASKGIDEVFRLVKEEVDGLF